MHFRELLAWYQSRESSKSSRCDSGRGFDLEKCLVMLLEIPSRHAPRTKVTTIQKIRPGKPAPLRHAPDTAEALHALLYHAIRADPTSALPTNSDHRADARGTFQTHRESNAEHPFAGLHELSSAAPPGTDRCEAARLHNLQQSMGSHCAGLAASQPSSTVRPMSRHGRRAADLRPLHGCQGRRRSSSPSSAAVSSSSTFCTDYRRRPLGAAQQHKRRSSARSRLDLTDDIAGLATGPLAPSAIMEARKRPNYPPG